MAIIKCPECGKEVSDLAKHCPHCGFPINEGSVDSAQMGSLQSKKTVICADCGKEESADSKYCTGCGALLTTPEDNEQAYQYDSQDVSDDMVDDDHDHVSNMRMSRKKLYLILGGTLLVAAIAVVVILLVGGSNRLTMSSIQGTWKIIDASGRPAENKELNTLRAQGDVCFIFDDGDLFISCVQDGKYMKERTGSYEVIDGKLYMYGHEMECNIKGNEMELIGNNGSFKCRKQ